MATGSVDIENSIVAGNVATASGVTVATNCAGAPGRSSRSATTSRAARLRVRQRRRSAEHRSAARTARRARGADRDARAGASSKAIDGGDGGCTRPRGTAIVTDQRGISRPQGSACDIVALSPAAVNVRFAGGERCGEGRPDAHVRAAGSRQPGRGGAEHRDGVARRNGSRDRQHVALGLRMHGIRSAVASASATRRAPSARRARASRSRPRPAHAPVHAPDGQAHRSPHHEETGDVHVHGDPCHQRPMRRLPASQVRALQALQVAADLPSPKRDRRVQGQGDRTGRHGQRGIRRSARRCQAGLVPVVAAESEHQAVRSLLRLGGAVARERNGDRVILRIVDVRRLLSGESNRQQPSQ